MSSKIVYFYTNFTDTLTMLSANFLKSQTIPLPRSPMTYAVARPLRATTISRMLRIRTYRRSLQNIIILSFITFKQTCIILTPEYSNRLISKNTQNLSLFIIIKINLKFGIFHYSSDVTFNSQLQV